MVSFFTIHLISSKEAVPPKIAILSVYHFLSQASFNSTIPDERTTIISRAFKVKLKESFGLKKNFSHGIMLDFLLILILLRKIPGHTDKLKPLMWLKITKYGF